MQYSPINIVFILDNGARVNSNGETKLFYDGREHEIFEAMDGTMGFTPADGNPIYISGIVEEINGTICNLYAQFTYEYDPMKKFIEEHRAFLESVGPVKDFYIHEETVYFKKDGLFMLLKGGSELVSTPSEEQIKSVINRLC